jgi:hypothetical protein
METVANIFAFVESMLKHVHVVSLLLGLTISIGFTQWAKFPLRLFADARNYPMRAFKFLVRTTAATVGFFGTWITWPEGGKWAVVWGLFTGFMTPLVYTGSVRVLARFWPWLADKASTDRLDDSDEAGV